MLSGISIWQLLILLVIVVLVFGTKRLRNLGGDLGSALKDFRGAMKDSDAKHNAEHSEAHDDDPSVVNHVSQDESTAAPKTGPVEDAQQRSAQGPDTGTTGTGGGDAEKHG